MVFIDFKTYEINGKRVNDDSTKKVEVSHNMQIENIEEMKIDTANKAESFIAITSNLIVKYHLGEASVKLKAVYRNSKDICEAIVKDFKKDKSIPKTLAPGIKTVLYQKSILKIIGLCDELSLPSPIPLPKVGISKKKEDKK